MEDTNYPRSIGYIVPASFFALMSLSGIRTAVSYYLTSSLGISEENAITIFHTFYGLGDVTAILWGIIADCYIGNFWAIFMSTCVSTLGTILVTLSSVPTLGLPVKTLCVVGMFGAAIGAGCKKSCLPAFGGDQFRTPKQLERLPSLFAILAWTGTVGILIATLTTPILRQVIPCFGKDSCYFLPFVIFNGLLVISNVIFVMGRNSYYMRPCEKNLLFRVTSCIWEAIKMKFKGLTSPSQSHWLDASIPKYGAELVADIQAVSRLTFVFLPLIAFWALSDQQITRWIFQAAKMSGDIGLDSFTLQPDQFMFFNSVTSLILVPLLDRVIYPALGKCNLFRKPLHRIFAGGCCMVLAFVMTGILQAQIDNSKEGEKVHMLWQLPQNFVSTLAFILFDITGMQFAYSEAPKSMKSTMQAVWFLISAIGNFLIVIISKFRIGNESLEYFIHGGICLLFMILFLRMAESYLKQKKRNNGTAEIEEKDCLNPDVPNERKGVEEHVL